VEYDHRRSRPSGRKAWVCGFFLLESAGVLPAGGTRSRTTEEIMENRVVRAVLPALLIHVAIGTVYCWSSFSGSLAELLGVEQSVITWAFSIAIFFLGMSAAFMGRIVEMDIRKSALISCICFTTGFVGTGFVVLFHSFLSPAAATVLVFLLYGAVMGVGLGVGYLTPVKNLMLWFPKNKGLATGISIMGFGLAKAIGSPVMNLLQEKTALSNMFFILGAVYCAMILAAHFMIKKPAGWVETPQRSRHVIRNKPLFAGIWFMFYINITCGLALISYEKSILQMCGLGVVSISLIQSLTAVSNAVGRIGSSTISDFCRDRNTIYKFIFTASIIVTVLAVTTNAIAAASAGVVIALLLVINFGYGGGFSTLPALLESRFGMENISQIHGLALSAWAFAGLSGNQITALSLRLTGGYRMMLFAICGLYIVALIVSLRLNKMAAEASEEIIETENAMQKKAA